MKKYIYAFFFASLIIVALGLKAKIKSDTEFSELTLSNIEAVSAEGPHYKIKGKLKENPCK